MAFEVGQEFGGLVLAHRLAEGGMSSVWAASHADSARLVAVKLPCRGAGAGPDAVRRLAAEGRMMERIRSPHVPRVIARGVCPDGTPYLAMELIDGLSLRAWVAQHGQLALVPLLRLVEHLCLALGSAQAQGVVHRDLKPDNIVVSGSADDLHATLVDFGIAKSVEASERDRPTTLAGTAAGTLGFMSPEQLRGVSEVDVRADLWALGVVAYWSLTGRLPFEGTTVGSLRAAVERGHFVPVSELTPGVPCEVDAWFAKALSKDPEDRWQSPGMMSAMLKVAAARPAEWTRPLPAIPRPVTSIEKATVASPPRPAGLPLRVGAAALLALLCVFAISLGRATHPVVVAPVPTPPVARGEPVASGAMSLNSGLSQWPNAASFPAAAAPASPTEPTDKQRHSSGAGPIRGKSTARARAVLATWHPRDALGEP